LCWNAVKSISNQSRGQTIRDYTRQQAEHNFYITKSLQLYRAYKFIGDDSVKYTKFNIQCWRKFDRSNLILLAFGFFSIFVINIFLIFLPLDTDSVIYYTFDFMSLKQGDDSWGPMSNALVYMQSNHQGNIYDNIFFEQNIKFQYPLTSLLLMCLLNLVFRQYIDLYILLNLLSFTSVIVTIIFVLKIFRFNLKKNHSSTNISTYLILIIYCLTFYPLIKAYTLGQIQTIINCLLTMAFWYWLIDRKKFAGILVGAVVLFKPNYLIIILWGFLRKNRCFYIYAMLTIAIGTLISVILFGIDNNIRYLEVIEYISRHGEGFYPNQSINGLLNRLFFNGNNLFFDENSFAPYHPLIYLGTIISSMLIIALGLFYPIRYKFAGNAFDFAIIMITATVASPIAWEHHYGILLSIYAYLSSYLMQKLDLNRKYLLLLAISYILTSNFFKITNIFAHYILLNVLQSYLLMGVIILMAETYILGRTQTTGTAPSTG